MPLKEDIRYSSILYSLEKVEAFDNLLRVVLQTTKAFLWKKS